MCENLKACFIVSVWLFFLRIVCRITIHGNMKACFCKPYKGIPRIAYRSLAHSVVMKAVPSVLHYLGKCTAGFSLNCVHTLSNCVMDEVALSKAR